jgi:hypothetical protein
MNAIKQSVYIDVRQGIKHVLSAKYCPRQGVFIGKFGNVFAVSWRVVC